MVHLINAFIFLCATVFSIIDRVKFEKNEDKEKEDKKYVSLYREHSTFQIVCFAALLVFCLCSFFNV